MHIKHDVYRSYFYLQTEGTYDVVMSVFNPLDGWVSSKATTVEVLSSIGPIVIDDFLIVSDYVSVIFCMCDFFDNTLLFNNGFCLYIRNHRVFYDTRTSEIYFYLVKKIVISQTLRYWNYVVPIPAHVGVLHNT